jgi:acetyl-CoA C-acetyltransferase
MKNVYIVSSARTAIGNFAGTLAGVSAAELGKTAAAEAIKRANLKPEMIDDVIMGCVLQAGLGQNVARQVAMGAGIPKEKTALTVNMVCGSGLRTVAMAAQSILAGDAEIILAGGTESMSNAPYVMKQARNGFRMGHAECTDSMIADGLWDVFGNVHMGITAENLSEKFGISRADQDAFAAASQQKAEKAIKERKFVDEIVPVLIPQKKGDPMTFAQDEFPRAGTTAESLGKLRPAFKKDGTVTAGNASGINDGAACVVVAGEDAVKKHGLKPMARIVSYAWHGTDPSIMGIGPVEAVNAALKKASWSLKDVELIEANEAFAAQSLSVGKELGWNPDIVNVNGGAIALGHPIGASGARVLVTLLHEMKRRNVQKGLVTLCIGGGMGVAMCVESVRG